MIRLASEQDLPAIAAIYEAILDHEDATVRCTSAQTRTVRSGAA